jgi:hypothetical protein
VGLVSDHDPKPLDHVAVEHASQFSWDYLQRARQACRCASGEPPAAGVLDPSGLLLAQPNAGVLTLCR